ncbi:39S ribosomal protein L28, mitochondrial [Dirofilaria immitis]|nr:39S ribosomal protein L28, mitochondrial [Dirofilaria immitis]
MVKIRTIRNSDIIADNNYRRNRNREKDVTGIMEETQKIDYQNKMKHSGTRASCECIVVATVVSSCEYLGVLHLEVQNDNRMFGKNLKSVTNLAPVPIITWDRAERIRRNKEIWDNKNSIFVLSQAKPVHYRKPVYRYEWDTKRRIMVETEDYPLTTFHPQEADKGLWGGEMVVKILPKHWVPHFFFPRLKSVIVYSEVLNKHMKITVTERTCRLIDQHFGLDLYLLETPEIDIGSKLGIKLKREILLVLAKGTYYPNDPERHNFIKQKYTKFVIPIEEADWFGLDLNEACRKQQEIEESVKPIPEKYKFELDLVKRLAVGEENPDHDKVTKELESQSVIGQKARKLMQIAAQRLKK